MKKILRQTIPFILTLFLSGLSLAQTAVEETAKQEPAKTDGSQPKIPAVKLSQPVQIAQKAVTLMAPKSWVKKKPRSRIVEHEFGVTAIKGDPRDGRLTIMPSGGSVQANIDRWVGQFSQPDGTATKAKVTKKKIGEHQVHIVDLQGTFKDALRGPFGPKTDREGYRMLGAIVELSKESKPMGNYYIKLYGPVKTIKQNEKAYMEFVQSLKMK